MTLFFFYFEFEGWERCRVQVGLKVLNFSRLLCRNGHSDRRRLVTRLVLTQIGTPFLEMPESWKAIEFGSDITTLYKHTKTRQQWMLQFSADPFFSKFFSNSK